jgi:Rod binding domain-containing protein
MAVSWPTGLSAASQAGVHLAGEPKLVRAAHEFEAQLMKELLRPLIQSSKLLGNEDTDETGGAGTLGEFAAESLAESLSTHGGLGIANRIIGELSRSGNASQTSPVTEKLHIDTVMNLRK